ncbi:unnamed protein product [Allacma fusca]|uniref:Uncharacterized protein n=1 Tax=Allacma fusca TaxID=39272 RepID=A0A8J2KL07_9HEXA|nr:unnamed protein product [Allacma fusca]
MAFLEVPIYAAVDVLARVFAKAIVKKVSLYSAISFLAVHTLTCSIQLVIKSRIIPVGRAPKNQGTPATTAKHHKAPGALSHFQNQLNLLQTLGCSIYKANFQNNEELRSHIYGMCDEVPNEDTNQTVVTSCDPYT